MNDNNPNVMLNGMPPMPQKSGKKVGLTLLVLGIILLILLGVIYMLGGTQTPGSDNTATQGTESTDPQIIRNESAIQDSSDAQLESDLDAQLKDVDYSF